MAHEAFSYRVINGNDIQWNGPTCTNWSLELRRSVRADLPYRSKLPLQRDTLRSLIMCHARRRYRDISIWSKA